MKTTNAAIISRSREDILSGHLCIFSRGIFAVTAGGKVTDIFEEVCVKKFLGRISFLKIHTFWL